MLLWLRNIAAYAVCAIAAVAIVHWLESSVVSEAILPSLITIVIALLAINVQTTAVIAVKLRELATQQGIDFTKSVHQFRLAFIEQAILFLVSLGLVTLSSAESVVISQTTIELGSFFVIFATLHIFIDTTIALLDCLFPPN